MLDEPTIDVSARAIRELLADAKHAGDKAFMDGDKFGQVWHSAQCHAYKLLLEMHDQ
jgi:hypothetical protein